MDNRTGCGLFIAGIVMIVLGLALRTGLIQWLIDATGFILIVLGIIFLAFGIWHWFTNRD